MPDYFLRFEEPATERESDKLGPFPGPLVFDGLTLKDASGKVLASTTLDDHRWSHVGFVGDHLYTDLVIWVGPEGLDVKKELIGFQMVDERGVITSSHEWYEWLQLTYHELRIAPDGDEVAYLDDEGRWVHGDHSHRTNAKVKLYAA